MFIIFQAEYFIASLLFILCSRRSNIIRKVRKLLDLKILDHFLSTTWHGQLWVVQVSMFKLKNSYSYPQPYRYVNALLLYFVLCIRSRHVRQNSRTNKRKKDRWASGRYIYLTHFVECHKKMQILSCYCTLCRPN